MECTVPEDHRDFPRQQVPNFRFLCWVTVAEILRVHHRLLLRRLQQGQPEEGRAESLYFLYRHQLRQTPRKDLNSKTERVWIGCLKVGSMKPEWQVILQRFQMLKLRGSEPNYHR